MGLIRLPESGRAYIDTSALIYIVESVSPFAERLESVWESLLSGKLLLITSELSLMEVMVLPLRRHDAALEARYSATFSHEHIQLIPVGRQILLRAAAVRATNPSMRTPDAIHSATAIASQVDVVITNDKRWRSIEGLNVVYLGDVD